MKTSKIITNTIATLALAVTLGACSTDPDQTASVTPAPSVVATTPAAEATEPGAVLAPEVDVPAVGETVAAGQVEAIRAAGAAVYVSPLGDGTGFVVQPGQELPAAVQAEVVSVASSAPPAAMADLSKAGLVQVNDALIAAGTGVFVLQYGGEFNTDGSLKTAKYVVVLIGGEQSVRQELNNAGTLNTSKEAALTAFAAVQAAHPEIPFIDATV